MKYDVTVFDRYGRLAELERGLKHCRTSYTLADIERWDYPCRAPEFEGYELRFTTKNRKILKYLGFSDEAIKNFAVYRTPFKKFFRDIIRRYLPF